jgi:ABC-type phosphate transport system auxiliary subunit
MFENFRRAWRQAVDNFWTELEGGSAGGDARARALYREVANARNQLGRLEREIGECRHGLDHERKQADVCARRERMAHDIGDVETARIAADYRARHEERAQVLSRKLDALQAERALCERCLQNGTKRQY